MSLKRERFGVLVTLALAVLRPAPAAAVDGVIEINQARALAGGVTPGDGAGFPVTIDTAGSYRLTSNLTVPDNQDGIVVGGSDMAVTLDLNGFAINAPSPSSGTPAGIHAPLTDGRNTLQVHDGIIRGFYDGIATDLYSGLIQSVTVMGAKFRGIDATGDVMIVDSNVSSNGLSSIDQRGGIFVGGRSIVRGCKLYGNVQFGIHTGPSALVTGNDVTKTFLGSGTSIGISVGDGSTVNGNTVNDNRTGVQAANGVTLLDNTVRSSLNAGFDFTGSNNGYARNVLTNNTTDVLIEPGAAATELGTNFCGSDTVCP